MTTTSKNAGKQTFGTWKKMVDDQLNRIETAYEEIGRYEKQAIDQAGAAIDEISRLMKDSLDYTVELSGEWRKLGNEALQRSGKFMGTVLGN